MANADAVVELQERLSRVGVSTPLATHTLRRLVVLLAGEEIVYLDAHAHSTGWNRSSGEVVSFTPTRVLRLLVTDAPQAPEEAPGGHPEQTASVTCWPRRALTSIVFGEAGGSGDVEVVVDRDTPWAHSEAGLPRRTPLRLTYAGSTDALVLPLPDAALPVREEEDRTQLLRGLVSDLVAI